MPKEITIKFPKSLAVCADKYYALREKRLSLQKEVDAIQAEENAYRDHLIDSIPKSEATGVAGKVCRVSVKTDEVPKVEDWDLFYKHIKKTGEFDLLGRTPTKSAIEARWENGKKIPGVGTFTVVKLSVNKL